MKKIIVKRFIVNVLIGSAMFIILNFILPPYHQQMLLEILIWTLFAASFDILFGFTGLLSFGQCLFFGIGAYGTALAIIHWNLPIIPAIFFGVICATGLAALVGPLIIKLESHYFVIFTVLLALVFLFFANNISGFTGGDDGLSVAMPQNIFYGIPLFASPTIFINNFIIVVAVSVFVLCLLFVKSPVGLILKGVRENSQRVAFLGYPVKKYFFFAWVIAGAVAGISGSLYVLGFRYVSTAHLQWTLSGEGIVWVIIGGKGTLFGSLVGSSTLLYLRDILSVWSAAYPLLIGILLIILIRSFPEGILGVIKSKFLNDMLYRSVTPGVKKEITGLIAIDEEKKFSQLNDHEILIVEKLSKSFGGIRAVDNVSFTLGYNNATVIFFPNGNDDVKESHIKNKNLRDIPDFSIVGPNAAGKSTFFNLLTGLIEPDYGKIIFKGKTIFENTTDENKKVTMPYHKIAQLGIARTFQHLNIFPRLSVYENLWLACQSNNTRQNFFAPAECDKENRNRVDYLLTMMKLEQEANQQAGTLSYGRQKILELGLALALNPVILLLDEPTAGVSLNEVDLILDTITSCSSRMGLMIIEHDIEIIKKLNFRTCVFGNGKIIFEGTPDEILKNTFVQEHFLGAVATC